MNKSLQYVELLQGWYNYLYMGKFLEQVIMHNDLSVYASNISVPTTDSQRFMLNGDKIKQKLKVIYDNPGKKNVFGYLVELSSFRGVFGVMKEVIEDGSGFQKFISKNLGKQAFPFEQIIRLIRNCLVHAASAHIELKSDDFYKQRDFLLHHNVRCVHFRFLYADFIPQRSGSKTYGIDIKIDFAKLAAGQSFRKVISLHQMYMLAELCYNLSELYRHKKVSSK